MRLFSDRRGATSIEYGLIAAGIAIAVIAALAVLGPAISTLFSGIQATYPAN